MRRLAIFVVAAACLAPLALRVPASALAAAAEQEPGIVLERAAEPGLWRATYRLPVDVTSLRFDRPAGFFRERVWQVVTPGWRLVRDGEFQLLEADHAARELVVEFPEFSEQLPKEYEFFTPFTDGSVAIYSGHLAATVGDAVIRDVEVRPDPGEHVAVLGEVADGARVWSPPADGTYIYVGTIAPVETDDVLAILDPGAPGWLLRQLATSLPRVLADYTTGFGEHLPSKPFVLFNFDDAPTSGRSSGGGTLTGLIQMGASGRGWLERTPGAEEGLLGLIAHEAAHMWNGQIHTFEDSAGSWMHEGSAEAFAADALVRAGVIDAARLAARRTEALNRCASGLSQGSLATAEGRQAYQDFYSCGEMIAVWSVAATPSAGADALFELWRAVLGAPGAQYNRDSYFNALRTLGASDAKVEALQAFIDDSHDDSAAALVDLFASVGVAIGTLDRPAPADRSARAVQAFRHLMSTACDGRMSFYHEGERLRSEPIAGCEPFAAERRIVAIESHAVSSDGDLAYEAARAKCGSRKAVVLGLEDGGTVLVPCEVPPPALPRPLSFPEIGQPQ